MKKDLTFTSHGVRCAAWHLPATSAAPAGPGGRPCVVMAHGFGGTRDSGLLAYAEGFAEAGIDAFVFDYRGFGASEGTPRQNVSVRRQREDYHAALAAARRLPGVDPDRIALWGTSYAGGHVLPVAAQDGRIAAVVSLTPAVDGLATLGHVLRHAGVGRLLRLTGHGLWDAARAVTGLAPHHLPVVAHPGTAAMMTTPLADRIAVTMAGPTWRNEVCARAALAVGLNRPTAYARRVDCPILLQIGTDDHVAPPDAARQAARKAGSWAEISEYPVDHFDVYDGEWQKRALADQLAFLTRCLDPSRPPRHNAS
ncbi:alpha/beta fold hydrolase [Streptomyces sp. NPDC048623]|uniref:alpha/beta hydrolase n=1 Tax=Streptomyces sp. NPDC048623 TaxID=3155761 RepID=UPI00341605B3